MGKYYHYFVEGDDDRKVVNTLKTDFQFIISGKVDKFNVVDKTLKKTHLMNLKEGTTVVLVFDTDTGNVDILNKNIEFLKQQSAVEDIICITQIENLEDELVRSTSIKEIKELTKSRTNSEFKKDVLHISNLKKRMEECSFDFSEFWSSKPKDRYKHLKNEADKIKKNNCYGK